MQQPVLLYSGRFCRHSREVVQGLGSGTLGALRTVDVDAILDRLPSDLRAVPALLLPRKDGSAGYHIAYDSDLRMELMRIETAAAAARPAEPEVQAFADPGEFCGLVGDKHPDTDVGRYATASDDVHISFRPDAGEEGRCSLSEDEMQRELDRRARDIQQIFPPR
jgi:hypothetical protein